MRNTNSASQELEHLIGTKSSADDLWDSDGSEVDFLPPDTTQAQQVATTSDLNVVGRRSGFRSAAVLSETTIRGSRQRSSGTVRKTIEPRDVVVESVPDLPCTLVRPSKASKTPPHAVGRTSEGVPAAEVEAFNSIVPLGRKRGDSKKNRHQSSQGKRFDATVAHQFVLSSSDSPLNSTNASFSLSMITLSDDEAFEKGLSKRHESTAKYSRPGHGSAVRQTSSKPSSTRPASKSRTRSNPALCDASASANRFDGRHSSENKLLPLSKVTRKSSSSAVKPLPSRRKTASPMEGSTAHKKADTLYSRSASDVSSLLVSSFATDAVKARRSMTEGRPSSSAAMRSSSHEVHLVGHSRRSSIQSTGSNKSKGSKQGSMSKDTRETKSRRERPTHPMDVQQELLYLVDEVRGGETPASDHASKPVPWWEIDEIAKPKKEKPAPAASSSPSPSPAPAPRAAPVPRPVPKPEAPLHLEMRTRPLLPPPPADPSPRRGPSPSAPPDLEEDPSNGEGDEDVVAAVSAAAGSSRPTVKPSPLKSRPNLGRPSSEPTQPPRSDNEKQTEPEPRGRRSAKAETEHIISDLPPTYMSQRSRFTGQRTTTASRFQTSGLLENEEEPTFPRSATVPLAIQRSSAAAETREIDRSPSKKYRAVLSEPSAAVATPSERTSLYSSQPQHEDTPPPVVVVDTEPEVFMDFRRNKKKETTCC